MVNWFLRGLFIFMLGACSRAETPVQKQTADKQPYIKSQSPVVVVQDCPRCGVSSSQL